MHERAAGGHLVLGLAGPDVFHLSLLDAFLGGLGKVGLFETSPLTGRVMCCNVRSSSSVPELHYTRARRCSTASRS